ncbi:serine-rich adhesin for platelets-like isoform X2 [Bombus huntii]|uniref:serine-rich adhesin for platelets-like isoform X2 n=1 Tax=Bombus huntii TaxID=85661 RepID=UPI0021A9B1DE|nr:serine-rich adhesin for platelets-like isoform X2 [Bombus huntii]
MAAPQASSRLELLQARFQQKQLQEKEQKLLQLYDQQQQRAYQVVQRGSAGSNSSNHATSISQHTVTKTSSSSHTTSTSQGGKVRQMFDERRQTTVKGIDRSYPLEPLENKSRKQTNGNGVQKNGNLTVNRQSVTVKRVAKADVNSNLNGGKPIVSYHEEISRESFGPCARQHQEDDEFGNENHVTQYANGNHRDETRMEEVLDEDMIERNRMMAKLHLMEYDETLKHRVKNDLESEEFPEDFMVDVPDKLPKQSVTRKLSQAEVRLERFKNANARRGNNVTKNPAIGPKKRSDPIFPAKSTCSASRMTNTASDRRSNDGKNPASSKSRGKTLVSGNVGETVSLDSGRNVRRRDENPRFFCEESEKSATVHAVGSKTARKLSPDSSEDRIQRSERSAIFNKEKSAIKYPIDSKAARTSTSESLKDKTGKRQSHELFSKDAGKSTVTSATGATTARNLSSEALRDVKDQGDHGKFIGEESEKSATTYAIRPKSAERPIREVSEVTKDIKRRSESPKFFCKESERSATTYAIDSKTAEKYTREPTKDTGDLKRRSESPKFLSKESEKSATTYAIRPKSAERPIREVSEVTKDIKRRSESPKFFCKESERSATTYAIDSKTAEKYTRESTKDTGDLKRRSESPKFLSKESEKSATTYAIRPKSVERPIREVSEVTKDIKRRSESPKFFCKESEKSATTYAIRPKSAERPIHEVSEVTKDIKRRSESPKFFCKESERSATTYAIRPKSAERPIREVFEDTKDVKRRSESPKFFCKESEKSATTYAIDEETNKKFSLEGLKSVKKRSDSPKPTTYAIEPKSAERLIREVSEDIKDVKRRSESPRFFCKESERSATTYAIEAKTNKRFSFEDLKDVKQRRDSPKSTTHAIDSKRAERSIREPAEDIKDVKRRSESPRFFCEGSERSAKTYAIDRKAANSSKTRTPRSDSPKFFCKESEKSDTAYAIDSTILPTSPNYMKDSKSSVLKIESKNKKDITSNTIRESTNDTMKRHATFPKRDVVSKSSSSESAKYDVISCAKPEYQTLRKFTETKLPDVFERLTRERSSSPRSFCREGRRSATTMSTRNRDTESISVSANAVEEMKKKGSESRRVGSGKRDASIIRADESKSPDFAKASSRSCSVSPQYFGSDSDRSASILMVTPETIVKAKTDLAWCKKREQSPTLYVSKGEKLVTNVPREATRGSSTESYDETAKRFIRSSVSRFFSEQCERAARNVEPRKLQLTDARTPSQTKSQFDDGRAERDERTSFVADGSRDSSPGSRGIVESREETPESLRYETEECAIATSLQPKIYTDVEQPPKGAHSLKQTVTREITARPRNLSTNVKDRFSKSPLSVKDDNLTAENANALSRRGSAGVLRSTKLIRDVLQRQSGQDQVDASPGISSEWEERPRADRMQAETRVDRKVEERAGTPTGRQLGSKSCKSVEVDTQIGEVRTPERYVKQEQLRGTYSRSSKGTACEKSSVGKLLTYSVRKPVKQRGSLLESNIFQQSLRGRDSADERPVSSKRTTRIASPKKEPAACARSLQTRTKGNTANGKNKSDILKARSQTASPISASSGKTSSETVADKRNMDRYDASKRIMRTSNESIARDSEGATDVADRSGETKIPRAGARTARKQSIADERKKGKTSKQAEILKSMQLVRSATRGSDFAQESRKMVGESVDEGTARNEQTEMRKSCCPSTIDIRRSEAGLTSIKELSKNYERTDSVESALRRFDSIGTEAESIRGTLERSVESIPKEIRRKSGGSIGRKADSKTISPKALDPPNVNLFAKRTCASKATTVSRSAMAAAKGRQAETQETRRQKKLEKARDSIEISRIAIRSRSLSCKRKLFQHTDSSETGSVASRCSIDSLRNVERLSTTSNKKKTRDSVNTTSKRFEFSGNDETSTQTIDKAETDKMTTGVGCSSTKQLRSIEDIRRSIEDESWDRETGQPSVMSAIVGSVAKAAGRSEPRRINVNDRAGNRKEICSPGRSVNLTASNDALGDTERSSVKCTMRFSRVAKSPSPETTKETSIRARRNIPTSPSKSPDTVARRASSELKAQDTRSTKRPTTMKGTEPIGNRKALTATSTTTKKSADVVDSAILENGLHLRDQTAETKYDNDSPTKKSDALVVDLDEQPPKENEPLPRKPLLRKQSTEKQITSMQSTRPPSVSSTSGGSPMQGQTSGSRSKMASRAKTPISGSTGYKGSASSRTGGAAAATCYSDALVPCKMCGRRFAQDRVTLHEQICAKTTQKKRKQFDTMMYRVKGTDLEPFVKKGLVKKQVEKSKKPEIKSNWRRKHEDFINAIRSAKQVQAHLAAGGKLSDLPPPPVSDNYDYIQCPHCGRKFNKAAAERHIPKCEHMLHNKPIHSRAPKPRR